MSCRQNGLVRNIRLVSKFTTSQPGLQLQNTYFPISHKVKVISQWNLVSLENTTKEIFFFKNHAENDTGRLVSDLFLFCKIKLLEVKAIGM